MAQPVIVAGARTPIGKLLGSLSVLPAPELAEAAISAALERAGITGGQVDAVIMGNVVQARRLQPGAPSGYLRGSSDARARVRASGVGWIGWLTPRHTMYMLIRDSAPDAGAGRPADGGMRGVPGHRR